MSVKEQSGFNKHVDALRALSTPVRSTAGSVTAGVGDVLSGRVIAASIPEVDESKLDLTSDEAHELFKEYNTKVNKETNKVAFYSSFFDRLSNSLFIGAFAGIGVALSGGVLGPVGAGALLVGAAVAVGLIGLMAKQNITHTQTGKGMDITDFEIKREAALIAKEIKTALDEERTKAFEPALKSHAQTRHGVTEDGTKWAEYVEQHTVTSNERIH